MTQEQLAEQIGCAAITLRKIEGEERRPSAQIVERLAEIFSIPPNEQTSFLLFARGDWKAAPTMQSEDAPWHVSTKSTRSNLPASITSLIGREQEIASVREYVTNPDIRLVTLIGPPGIGKTRLSVEAAREMLSDFSDGVFFAALAPLEDPNLIASTISQTLGFVETELKPPIDRLKEGIGEKQMLLVLDNLEHIIEGAAPIVSELLMSCPRLKLLTTSREALRVSGEWLYPVPTLVVPTDNSSIDMEIASQFSALTLFAERAHAVRPEFVLSADNLEAVANICTQLDGLPLAIELIAPRIRLMSPQALLQRLSDQFTLYADGRRAVSARQKTLHSAIAWSYDLLSTEEQNLFARLSVFSGGFTLEAAESIFSRTVADTSITDLIASLLDKSLLQPAPDREARGEPRFNMLVTIQQFAFDCLQHMGEDAKVRNWHLDYFLDLAEQTDKEIHGPDQVRWMDRVEKEHDNFRAALEWCLVTQKTEAALNLLGTLGWAWFMRGYYGDARSWFEKIHAMPDFSDYPLACGRTLNVLGLVSYSQGDYSNARVYSERALSIFQAVGVAGESGVATALDQLGMVASDGEGDFKGAQDLSEKSAELHEKCGDRRGYARALFHLGLYNQDTTLALSLFEKSLAIFSQLGDAWGLGRVYDGLSSLYSGEQNYAKARSLAEQALAIEQRIGFRAGIVNDLIHLGTICLAQGDDDAAMGFYQASLDLGHQSGLKEYTATALHYLGLLALRRRDYEQAIAYLNDSLASYPNQSYELNVAERLAALAAVAGATNQPERAAKLSGAAQSITDTTDYRIPPFDRTEFDRHIQIAREQLGDVEFETLAAEGRAMTIEQAIQLALS